MIRQAPGQPEVDRRSRVLAAAVEEFARSGYSGASTNRIAVQARVAKGLIFHYFGSKEGLYRAALDEAWPSVFGGWDRPLPKDPFERLPAAVMARLNRLGNSPLHARLVADVVRQRRALSPALRSRVQNAYTALRLQFKEGAATNAFRPEVPPEQGLDLLALVAEGLERRYVQTLTRPSLPDVDPLEAIGQEIDIYVDLLRRGIYRPEARGPGARPREQVSLPQPGPRPAGSPGNGRRDRILQAAQEVFAARGYDGASTDAIAARAGVAKGLLFHHFGTKAGLYLATVQEAAQAIIESFFRDVARPPTDLFQRLSDWSLRKLQVFQANPRLYQLVLNAVTRPPEAVWESVDQYVQQAIAENWPVILKGIDTTPFREEVPPARALDLVMLVLDTMSNQQLERLAGEAADGMILFDAFLQEANAYLALLRDGLCPA